MRRPPTGDEMPKDWLFTTVNLVLVMIMVVGTVLAGYFMLRAFNAGPRDVNGMSCSNIDAECGD